MRTPFHPWHVAQNGRMVDFAGWDMPVQYTSISEEHHAVRNACGLFDVSHMARLRITGPDAALALETLIPVDILGLAEKRQRYGFFTNDQGGILDDLMFANRGDHLYVVVNAACKSADIAHMKANLRAGWKRVGFDITKDRMLVKTGGIHASRGFSPLSLYELGNSLSELAELNGKHSLHIGFASRYEKRGEQIIDEGTGRYPALLHHAKPDQWTVIDLRPLRNRIFYQRPYVVSEPVMDWFKRFDLIVIPSADESSRPNGV